VLLWSFFPLIGALFEGGELLEIVPFMVDEFLRLIPYVTINNPAPGHLERDMLRKCMQATSTHLNLFQISNIHHRHFNMLNSTAIGVRDLAHDITCAGKLAGSKHAL
jgi:hypothetical protein